MTPHELGLFFGGAAGALVGVAIPIATLRAWFGRVDRAGAPARFEEDVTQVRRPDIRQPQPPPVILTPSVIENSTGRPPPTTRAIPSRLPIIPVERQLVPDLGEQARARAREVRDAVAGLGWPIARATQAADVALNDLGGGCPSLEDWVPAALRVLAPAAKRVPSLGPVNRRR